MKTEISSLELNYLAKEFKVLEGSKIDRIYHSKNNYKELTIVCHISNKGRAMLRTILPGVIFLDDSKDASESPTGFGMMLRKYLEGGRIRIIAQKDFERVLTITIETREKEEIILYNLIIELFSKGNMIFCDEKFQILNIVDEQEWKDRSLKRGETYKYPHSKINTLNIKEEEFTETVKNSGKESLVKALAISLNLGGVYSEELCTISSIRKDMKLLDVKESDYKQLYKNLVLMLHREVQANSVNENIYPFSITSQSSSDIDKENAIKQYESFSDAIRKNYDQMQHHENKKGHGKGIEKIQNIIDEQQKNLDEAQNEYETNQRKAEIIYEKYQEIDNIIKSLRDIRQKHSWKEIATKIKSDPKFSTIVKEVDEKNNSVIINID